MSRRQRLARCSGTWSATARSTIGWSWRGADGGMSGFAFPEVLVNVYECFAAGRTEDAFALFDAYLPLIRYEQQPGAGLAIRKEILHRRGVLASPTVRPPGARLDAQAHAELESLSTRVKRRIQDGI
jgi:4-hydroxy-tetrahydrodipicolinate synthase